MLRINLLPEDRRTVERTPLPRFLILLLGVALISGELAVGFYGYMKLRNLNARKQQKQEKEQSLQKHVETFNELKKEIRVLERRKEILAEISPGDSIKERYQWSYAIDQLFTVIDESPGVWISGLSGSMVEGEGRGAGAALTLSFQAMSATFLERMTKFTEWINKLLIKRNQVFTNLERNFRPLSSSREEGEKTFWRTQYKLIRKPSADDQQ